MKFKTVVITKKKLAVFFAVCLSVPVLAAAVKFMPKRTVSVFKTEDNIYEDILSEGLPSNEEKSLNIKSVLNKILGFDIDEPETIISEYSPVFDGTTSANEETEKIDETEETPAEDTPQETAEDTPVYEPPLPGKEQIDTAVNLQMNNATEYDVDLSALCARSLPFEVNRDEAQVLVIHTHTTECYDGDQMNGETERSTDDNVNVIAVGNEICAVLEENGIKTIHDTTYHDYPSYQGSYTRALSTIETQLANNPSIQIVLDIHRDAFVYSDGSKLAVTCEQNGIAAAQVMLVVGMNSMGLWHDNWQDNLTFAAKIQNAAEIMYPGLMRPINLRTERFNEHMTKGSLILEVGSNGNTLLQAKEGARYVARAIAAVLNAK